MFGTPLALPAFPRWVSRPSRAPAMEGVRVSQAALASLESRTARLVQHRSTPPRRLVLLLRTAQAAGHVFGCTRALSTRFVPQLWDNMICCSHNAYHSLPYRSEGGGWASGAEGKQRKGGRRALRSSALARCCSCKQRQRSTAARFCLLPYLQVPSGQQQSCVWSPTAQTA